MKNLIWLVTLVTVCGLGCSNLFLFPDNDNYFREIGNYVEYQEGFIPTPDGEKLKYWLVPAQVKRNLDKKPKGIVVQVHGNAQNLTAHIRSLGWLTEKGYSLFTFDYRGFGQSTGKPDLDDAFKDLATALDYVTKELNPDGLPVYFYGQSLGGTLLLKAVSSSPQRWKPAMIVVESSFYSYTQIAREKLAGFWISWPFQWLAYLAITGQYSLDRQELERISPTPVYLFYSERDPVVPVHNAKKIFQDLNQPKKLFSFADPGHTNAMWVQNGKYRDILLEAMASYQNKR
jgi:uncharacterized protein